MDDWHRIKVMLCYITFANILDPDQEGRSWSGSKPSDTLIIFLKECEKLWKKLAEINKSRNTIEHAQKRSNVYWEELET